MQLQNDVDKNDSQFKVNMAKNARRYRGAIKKETQK